MNLSATYQPANLEISFTETDSVLQVKLTGSMDERASERLKEAFDKLARAKQETVILDLKYVPDITTTGIGKLLVLHKRLQKQNRRFIIEKISDDLFSHFTSIKLDRLFKIKL